MSRPLSPHQYVDRTSGQVLTERLFGDRIVNLLYSEARERAPVVFRALTGKRMSSLLGWANFDLPLAPRLLGNRRFLAKTGVDLGECVEPLDYFTTPRRIFERQIRYWDCRPMPDDPAVVVSPADSRAVIGSFRSQAALLAKGKFFDLHELLGPDKDRWTAAFEHRDFAVFRLTPEEYHYNHTPVAGRVLDRYEVQGGYHSCNPGAVVEVVTPYSKNRRQATIPDTDVEGGTGLLLEKGRPKSLYRPGSSTDIVLFEPGRVSFEPDLVRNLFDQGDASRFSLAFGQPLVETEVAVRSTVGRRVERSR